MYSTIRRTTTVSVRHLRRALSSTAAHVADTLPAQQQPPPTPPTSFFIESYGCQQNASDSEIVKTILLGAGHHEAASAENATFVFQNTCSIRENAEGKIWHRLKFFESLRRKRRSATPHVAILGCMAERLKDKLLDAGTVDLVVGPDGYRQLPTLVQAVLDDPQTPLTCVDFSPTEHYHDIRPTRKPGDVSAYVSIMRGCNNMCTFCIVPFTRGREKSRDFQSIVDEITFLVHDGPGLKEVWLLGQNVNGYHDASPTSAALFPSRTSYQTSSAGFANHFNSRQKHAPGARFSDLLAAVAAISPELRVRFTSPHPKDFPPDVLDTVAAHPNICSALHMPLQSGSSTNLARMRRGYTKGAYLDLVAHARATIPGVTISTDIIAGFCGETEEEHADTLDVMERVRFEQAFMFAYSKRDKTHAARHLDDDVPEATKSRRLQEVIDTFRRIAVEKNRQEETGAVHLVLVEGLSTKGRIGGGDNNALAFTGRTDGNKRVVFTTAGGGPLPAYNAHAPPQLPLTAVGPAETVDSLRGTYVAVRIVEAGGTTLKGVALGRSSISDWAAAR